MALLQDAITALFEEDESTLVRLRDHALKGNWKDDGVRKSVFTVRRLQQQLGYSPEWMTEFVFNVITLAKKEPKPKDAEEKK